MTDESEKESPHSTPLISLFYQAASSLLQTVIDIEPPNEEAITPNTTTNVPATKTLDNIDPKQATKPLENIDPKQSLNEKDLQLNSSASSVSETLYSFFYDLAGINNNNNIPPASSNNNTDGKEFTHKSEFESPTSIFDASELEGLGFDMSQNSTTATPMKESAEPLDSGKYHPSRPNETVQPNEPALLNSHLLEKLSSNLPPSLRESSNIVLLYSMEKHGISISTLYRNTRDQGPCILALRNPNNHIFGAFLSESLHVHQGFYGNGECFLWTLDESTQNISIHGATGKNEYYILSEPHCIAFGGGDGKFGLWIDNELLNGSSQHCDTFENTQLSSSTKKEFSITGLEVWGFA